MKIVWIALIGLIVTGSGTFSKLAACSELPTKTGSYIGKGIEFIEEDWNLAVERAASENKYIFVDAYTSWCGPCKMLKFTTFKNKKAARFFNENFISVSINMEKGEGPQLARRWGIQAFPTLIILNPKGEPVLGTVGFIKAEDLLKFGREGLQKGLLL